MDLVGHLKDEFFFLFFPQVGSSSDGLGMMMLAGRPPSAAEMDHGASDLATGGDLVNGAMNGLGLGPQAVQRYGSGMVASEPDVLGDSTTYDMLLTEGDMEQLSLEIEKERLVIEKGFKFIHLCEAQTTDVNLEQAHCLAF
jgi:hypothetical protein